MLPLIFTLALSTPLAPPAGTYHYVTTMNGEKIASSAITVTRDTAGQIVLSETGSGTMNGQPGSIQDTLTLDPTLAPSGYQALASLADSKGMKAALTFDGDQAKQTGDVTKTYSLAPDAKHFVLTDFGPFTGYFALPAQMQAWSNAPVVAIVPLYAHEIPIAVDPSLQPDRPANVPAADRQISVRKPIQLTIWYDPSTLLVDEMDVPAEGVNVKRTP